MGRLRRAYDVIAVCAVLQCEIRSCVLDNAVVVIAGIVSMVEDECAVCGKRSDVGVIGKRRQAERRQ